jgi:hypothetical protein
MRESVVSVSEIYGILFVNRMRPFFNQIPFPNLDYCGL